MASASQGLKTSYILDTLMNRRLPGYIRRGICYGTACFSLGCAGWIISSLGEDPSLARSSHNRYQQSITSVAKQTYTALSKMNHGITIKQPEIPTNEQYKML